MVVYFFLHHSVFANVFKRNNTNVFMHFTLNFTYLILSAFAVKIRD